MLRQKGRPYLFSNSVAPAVVGASLKVFELLQESGKWQNLVTEYVRFGLILESMNNAGQKLSLDLKQKTNDFRTQLGQAGFELRGDFVSRAP